LITQVRATMSSKVLHCILKAEIKITPISKSFSTPSKIEVIKEILPTLPQNNQIIWHIRLLLIGINTILCNPIEIDSTPRPMESGIIDTPQLVFEGNGWFKIEIPSNANQKEEFSHRFMGRSRTKKYQVSWDLTYVGTMNPPPVSNPIVTEYDIAQWSDFPKLQRLFNSLSSLMPKIRSLMHL